MIDDLLRSQGYLPSREVVLAFAAALRPGQRHGARAILFAGPPGTGKTEAARALSRAKGWPLVYHLMHEWVDDQELYVGVDVAAAVEGAAGHVRQPGVLARAAELSWQGNTILLLDEVDKAPSRTEALLLDFLQTGLVPVRPGVQLRAHLNNLLVVLTTNDQRPLSDALLRRVRRVDVAPLAPATYQQVVAKRSGAPAGVVRLVCRMAREAETLQPGVHISPAEAAEAAAEVWAVAESVNDAGMCLSSWLGRSQEARAALRRHGLVPAIWAEVLAARRRGE